jgi:hypothetical protein
VTAPARVDAVELRVEAVEVQVLAHKVVAPGSGGGLPDRLHLDALGQFVQDLPSPFVLGTKRDDDQQASAACGRA